MPIKVGGGQKPAAGGFDAGELYTKISEVVAELAPHEKMDLVGALDQGRPFGELSPTLRHAFTHLARWVKSVAR